MSISKGKVFIDYEKELKSCSKCKEILPFKEFTKRSRAKTGLNSICKDCARICRGAKSVRFPLTIDYERELKSCSKCKEILPFSDFTKSSNSKTGLSSICKKCDWVRKGSRTNVKEPSKIDYDLELKECKDCAKMLPFCDFHKDSSGVAGLKSKCRTCLSKHLGPSRPRTKIDRDLGLKECSKCGEMLPFLEFHKVERGVGGLSARCNSCTRLECNRSKTKHKERTEKRRQERLLLDPNFKLRKILRGRLNTALKRNFKSGSAVSDLGCSIEELKTYLEARFYVRNNGEVMSWANHGKYGWHIDHIKPLSSFDLTDREQLLEAVHYTNLQPLWAEDNLAKGYALK